MILESYNPSNQKALGKVKITSKEEIRNIVERSHIAFKRWKGISLEERLEYVKRFYEKVEKERESLAQLVTKEMGMPITESLQDMNQGLEYISWYIENALDILKDEVTYEDDFELDSITFEPKGVIAIIVAWNFPFSVFVWQVVPNLIAGNTVIFKHSEQVPLSSQFINRLMSSVFPPDIYHVIYGDGEIGEALAKQNIDMLCFTGSTKVGQQLSKIAGEKMIPIILECGGSAPGIVLDDVLVDFIIESIYINRFTNTGQVCDGLKRLIVHESKVEEVCEKLANMITMKRIGDPLNSETDLGPLVSKDALNKIETQIQDAIQKGAQVICGGKKLDSDGNFFEPTLLTNITKDMKIWKEEVFGPVLPIVSFKTIEEAIELANDTTYGLGGYIYTNNKKSFEKIAKELKTGMVAWNHFYYLRPENPFGGVNQSGLGRIHSKYGLRNLCNMKVITYQKD